MTTKGTIQQLDYDKLNQLIEKYQNDLSVHTIRVYASNGSFVPHAYRHRCDIPCIEARRNVATGLLEVCGEHLVDAHRPRGDGSYATINNRPAKF